MKLAIYPNTSRQRAGMSSAMMSVCTEGQARPKDIDALGLDPAQTSAFLWAMHA